MNSSFICYLPFIDSHTFDITHLDNKLIIYLFNNFIKLKKKKENNMSITHIKTNKKIEVLLRLLASNENIVDASSKSGLNIEESKLIINNRNN